MTSTVQLSSRPVGPSRLQSFFIRGLLGCLSATAVAGIVVVLTASFDSTGARVLGTTGLTALYCVLCLADQTVFGTRFRPVAAVGIVTATAALAIGLSLIWWTPDDFGGDRLEFSLRTFYGCAVLAFAAAHAALLLRIELAPAGRAVAARTATLVAVSLVATMVAAPTVTWAVAETPGYWRLLAVLAILDVLGSVALPVLARLERTPAA